METKIVELSVKLLQDSNGSNINAAIADAEAFNLPYPKSPDNPKVSGEKLSKMSSGELVEYSKSLKIW